MNSLRKRSFTSWRLAGRPEKIKPSKYRSRRTTVDGITFHSVKEANRYLDLKLLEKAGEIRALKWQFQYELSAPRIAVPIGEDSLAPRRPIVIGKYVADFIYYTKQAEFIVEDVKGVDTPLSRWKRKHCEIQYGITIRIV